MILTSSAKAVSQGMTVSFSASGGVAPYTYSIVAGGVGGSINPSTGVYTAPIGATGQVTILATDSAISPATATKTILVCNALELFCDIIQTEMNLADGRVYIYNQKINQPKDNDIYIAVGILSAKPFGNTTTPNSAGAGVNAIQSVNMLTDLQVDIISRGPGARDRKEEIILALNSIYSQQQQTANSFYIAKISSNFVNLSNLDGDAIPYRFSITVRIQYFYKKTKAVDYFNSFSLDTIISEP